MTTTITAACFPTPHLALRTNNAAHRARIAAFAEHQAQAADTAAHMLACLLADAPPTDRPEVFRRVFGHVQAWRYSLAVATGSDARVRPGDLAAGAERFRTPITDTNADRIGTVGRLREGAVWDAATRTYQGGDPTPASDQMDLMGLLADLRFEAEAPHAQELVNFVRLPTTGATVAGNTLVRGDRARAVASDLVDRIRRRGCAPARFESGGDPMYAVTAPAATRDRIRDAAFHTLALVDVWPNPLAVWARAAYLLYQAPATKRGSDAVARVFLVAVAAALTGRALVLPQDIDLRAYVLPQRVFERSLLATVGEVTA